MAQSLTELLEATQGTSVHGVGERGDAVVAEPVAVERKDLQVGQQPQGRCEVD